MTTIKLWWLRATRHLTSIADDLTHRPSIIWLRTAPGRVWAFMRRRPFRLWATFMTAYGAGLILAKTDEAPTTAVKLTVIAIGIILLFGHGYMSGGLEAEHHKTVVQLDFAEEVSDLRLKTIDKKNDTIKHLINRLSSSLNWPNSILNAMANNHLINYPDGMFEQRWEENVTQWTWNTYVGDGHDHLVVHSDPDQVTSMQRAVEGFAKMMADDEKRRELQP